MPVLPVGSKCPRELPANGFQTPNEVADLHAPKSRSEGARAGLDRGRFGATI